MCLYSVSSEKPAAEGIGWKWLYESGSRLATASMHFGLRAIGEYSVAHQNTISGYGKSYMSGFHIYPSLEEAKRGGFAGSNNRGWKLYRVAYRKAHTQGLGDGTSEGQGLRQVIATEMAVLFEEGKRPQRDALVFDKAQGEFTVGLEDVPETEAALEFKDGEFHLPAYV